MPPKSNAGRVEAAGNLLVGYCLVRAGLSTFQVSRRAHLRELLQEVATAMEGLQQEYWLDFGALLGLVRGGDLILHDNDVDLAVLDPDWPAILEGLRRRLPKKYIIKVVTTKEEQPPAVWLRVYCPLGFLDLYAAHRRDDGTICVELGHGEEECIPADLLLPAARLRWRRGCMLSLPRNVEGTLEARYGPDWRTPRYLDKGVDTAEGRKLYGRLLRGLAWLGIRF